MKTQVLSALRGLDRRLAAFALARWRERPGLLAFMVHSLFADEREARSGSADPLDAVLVSDLQRCIEYFTGLGYRFVTPAEIIAGLDPAAYHLWMTFDDGYANNLRALPVLRAFGVPATFFVSVSHVAEGKSFWWDALYRERRRRGAGAVAIRREQAELKSRSPRAIEAYVRGEFGGAALDPIGDADRPLTTAELGDLAAAPLATLGNHGADHEPLTQCDDRQVRAQLRAGQDYLAAVGGRTPEAIAYPDGRCDRRIVRLARAEGLCLGAVTERGKNTVPLSSAAAMRILRYALPAGPDFVSDCLLSRSDAGVINILRPLKALWR